MGDGNGGFVATGAFKTNFKFAEGVRPTGAPRSEAGATVSMGWNQAMLAQAQGWGEMQIGHRPHHSRPHLLEGGRAPGQELHPDDGMTAQERARLRVSNHISGAQSGGSPATPSASRIAKGRASGAPVSQTGAASRAYAAAAVTRSAGVCLRSGFADAPLTVACPKATSATPNVMPSDHQAADSEFACQAGQTNHSDDCAPTAIDESAPSGSGPVRGTQPYGKIAVDPPGEEAGLYHNWELAREANDALTGLHRAWNLQRSRLQRGAAGASSNCRGSSAKVVKIGEGTLYIGEVDHHQKPHGEGVLLLADGAQHVGHFAGGRADGDGFYLTPKGLAFQGVWRQNMRIGQFFAVSSEGEVWTERYNESGKKVSRKRTQRTEGEAVSDAPLTIDPATPCVVCGHLVRAQFDHPYACRQHKGGWVPDHDAADRSGIWSCCGTRLSTDPGCEFSMHQKCS